MTIVIEKKFIIVPVNNNAVSKKLCFYENGEKDSPPIIALDCKIDILNPQYMAYIDVSRYLGRQLFYDTLPHLDLCLEQSDRRVPDGLYEEYYRPQVHFTPAIGWMNDPNGLIKHRGVYHLFFQYNPCGTEWGNMHWGHATSADLLHWEERDIALFPDDMGTMYSGSAIEDLHNVTGLQEGNHPPMLLFYTAAGDKSMLSQGKKRTQCLAYSNDGGKSFQKYRGNPVIGHVIHHNRDPKIVWVEELQKYLIALYLIEDRYQLFVSENLLDWSPLQEIRISNETECPDIFGFKTADKTYWVLMGASDKYVVGVFEDGKFLPITREKQLNYSPISYAGQSFSGLDDGRVIRMAWHRLNMPLLRAPHQMSLPVEIKMNVEASDLFLTASPVEEIKQLYADEKSIFDKTLDQPIEMNLDRAAYDIHMVTDYDGNITLDLFGHALSIDTRKNLLTFGKLTMPISGAQRRVDLRLLVDRCSFEVFADGGRYCATFYAVCDYNLPYLRLSAESSPVRVRELSCHRLASVHGSAGK